ncbi:hypothetical protein N1027_03935 [Herbiconiux sp. CPCC 205763]|uniref:Uncharacterized protein n=1 Tax=Herbiconiux aconitum TaxID=2970913 RepID=A0ABT2GM26_9MICO|nr:hypothetical protein [Herbiconiux aconitum]MCS5717282.1 hypothetical protein [Herbiconiux aconitum]
MTVAFVVLGILALIGIVATVRSVALDGYRRAPLRGSSTRNGEGHFAAH